MTDSKRDELKKLVACISGCRIPKCSACKDRGKAIRKWHNRQIREEMLALLPERMVSEEPYFRGFNYCIDEIRKKIEEKYK